MRGHRWNLDQSSCFAFLFSSFAVGNKLSTDTVHAHCAHTLQSICNDLCEFTMYTFTCKKVLSSQVNPAEDVTPSSCREKHMQKCVWWTHHAPCRVLSTPEREKDITCFIRLFRWRDCRELGRRSPSRLNQMRDTFFLRALLCLRNRSRGLSSPDVHEKFVLGQRM